MAKPKLTLYLDILSPFAYMAFYLTKNSPAFHPCEVTYVPIFLPAVIKATNGVGPLDIRNKKEWIHAERVRHQKTFNIPMLSSPPEPFPQSTLTTQRALCVIEADLPQHLPEAFAALYKAFWVEGKTIGQPENIAEALTPVLGEEETKAVMGRLGNKEIKARLTRNTEIAVEEEGCFGLPWFVATNSQGEREGFWGVDHMGQVLEFLGLDRGKESGLRCML